MLNRGPDDFNESVTTNWIDMTIENTMTTVR